MKKVPINCCCNPGERLGFVDVPDELYCEQQRATPPGEGPKVHLPLRSGGTLELEWGKLGTFLGSYTAIKSMDQPIEKLQDLVGFTAPNRKDETELMERVFDADSDLHFEVVEIKL